GEWEQVGEVAVLQRAGKEGAGRRDGLELGAVVPEADDHSSGVEVAERFEQQVDTLVVEELPEVDDRRLVGLEELSEAFGVALVRETLVSPARRIEASLVDQGGQRLLPRLGAKILHVDPRRARV